MASFRSTLEDCYLTDLGYNGPCYTWSNKRMDGTVTRVQLDRAVATSTWREHHRSMEVCVLAARSSNHNPVMVVFDKRETRSRGGSRVFKFEDKWWLDSDCSEIIKNAWDGMNMQGGPMMLVRKNQEQCKLRLHGWDKRKFGNMEKGVEKKTKLLANWQQEDGKGNQEKIKQLQLEIDKLLE